MIWFIIMLVLIACFGGVVFFGAPYLPTLSPQTTAALKLADLKPGEHLLELGCGDGNVLVAAARRGIRVTGYELNPILVIICFFRTRRYRKLVTIRLANFWRIELPPADAVFVFLLPRYMKRLDDKLRHAEHRPDRLISFAFQIPDRIPDGEQAGVFLYRYDR